MYLYIVLFLKELPGGGCLTGKEGIPSCSSSLAPRTYLSQRQESILAACKLASSEKSFKVTVAVADRSLLAFGGGGKMVTGKALCGWSGLSREGMLSPRPMSGPCSLTARTSSLGRGPTNARVGGQASKAGQKCCKILKHITSDLGRGLYPSQPPCSRHLSESEFGKPSCYRQNSSPQPVKALRAPWERFKL